MTMKKKIVGAVFFPLFVTFCTSASAMSPDASPMLLSSMSTQYDPPSLKQDEFKGLEAQPDSWNHLLWSAKGNVLKATNTGNSRLRLNTEIKLMPDNMPGTLEKSYILPGETLVVYGVCRHHLPTQTTVVVAALAEDGTDIGSKTMPISH
ncbi:hypothetical protein AAGR22_14070 [Erwinia sp. HDF1-3R]|uniref:hypothetical protein n=1 Tax=Erwinia sp. HDF1-3R TaxID=3141543 RepID=UPI0031F51CE9